MATDFSEGARVAREQAVTFAKMSGARVTLLHIDELPAWGYLGSEALVTPDIMASVAARTEEQLALEKKELTSAGVVADSAHGEGPPYLAIVRFAREGHYDLIVLGTHGRTGLQHLLVGSTAERVVRTATCPVLTVRGPEAAR